MRVPRVKNLQHSCARTLGNPNAKRRDAPQVLEELPNLSHLEVPLARPHLFLNLLNRLHVDPIIPSTTATEEGEKQKGTIVTTPFCPKLEILGMSEAESEHSSQSPNTGRSTIDTIIRV